MDTTSKEEFQNAPMEIFDQMEKVNLMESPEMVEKIENATYINLAIQKLKKA